MSNNEQPKRKPMPGRGMRGGNVRDIDITLLRRLLRLLMKDYPVPMFFIAVCIAASAIVGVVPAVFIKTVTGFSTDGLAAYAAGQAPAQIW